MLYINTLTIYDISFFMCIVENNCRNCRNSMLAWLCNFFMNCRELQEKKLIAGIAGFPAIIFENCRNCRADFFYNPKKLFLMGPKIHFGSQ